MIEEIVAGISSKIYETFGEDYEIHSDRVPQDLNEPCFIILPLTHTQQSKLSNSVYKRYYRRYPFNIQFYPKRNGNQYSENQIVAEKLYECLEYIETDVGLLRGSNMRYSVEDKELLSFVVNYNLFVRRDDTEELPKIESYTENLKLQEGQADG